MLYRLLVIHYFLNIQNINNNNNRTFKFVNNYEYIYY